MRVRRRDEGEGGEAVEEDGTEGGGGREEGERGRGRETQVARCGKKRRCGQRACQEGRSERGHHEHIGKRGITEPYLPYLSLDIMDVTARAGSGTSALCGIPGGGRPLPPPSRF